MGWLIFFIWVLGVYYGAEANWSLAKSLVWPWVLLRDVLREVKDE